MSFVTIVPCSHEIGIVIFTFYNRYKTFLSNFYLSNCAHAQGTMVTISCQAYLAHLYAKEGHCFFPPFVVQLL